MTDEYREARRDQIAQAAIRAIDRKGFRAASMADIIEESGLSAGAIYGHFRSKSDIVIFVAGKVVGARLLDVDRLAQSDPLPPPAAIIRIVLEGMLAELGRPRMLVQLWGEAISDPDVRELATGVIGRLRATYTAYIAHWHRVTHGLAAEAADELAREQVALFIGATQGYIFQSALLPDFDGEAYLAAVERYLPR